MSDERGTDAQHPASQQTSSHPSSSLNPSKPMTHHTSPPPATSPVPIRPAGPPVEPGTFAGRRETAQQSPGCSLVPGADMACVWLPALARAEKNGVESAPDARRSVAEEYSCIRGPLQRRRRGAIGAGFSHQTQAIRLHAHDGYHPRKATKSPIKIRNRIGANREEQRSGEKAA